MAALVSCSFVIDTQGLMIGEPIRSLEPPSNRQRFFLKMVNSRSQNYYIQLPNLTSAGAEFSKSKEEYISVAFWVESHSENHKKEANLRVAGSKKPMRNV